jgi:hypothetical protein
MSLKDLLTNRGLQEKIHAWQEENTSTTSTTTSTDHPPGQEEEEDVDPDYSEYDEDVDVRLPCILSVASSKTIVRALQRTENPDGKFALKAFKRKRREMMRRKMSAANAAAAAAPTRT